MKLQGLCAFTRCRQRPRSAEHLQRHAAHLNTPSSQPAAFSNAPHMPPPAATLGPRSTAAGIIFSNGEQWKSLRRFTLSTLRDFGMGKKSVEARIQDELMPLIESFKSHNGKPFNPHMLINSAVSNVICSIIFGKRFEYDDPTFEKLIKMLDENSKLVGAPEVLLYNYYPFLGSLLGLHKKVIQNNQDVRNFISQCSTNRRLDLDANDVTGYIDAFLLKQEQETTKAQTYFTEGNLLGSVLDLFAAGTETTSTTVRWGILLMTKYPEIQKKVQEEIKTHIKLGQLPTVEDRKKMPYTDAVIHEIQRFGNIVPLNLSHSTPTDVYLRGYLIPKGTEVIPLLTSVLYDKTQWKTPYDFNPNHFLDENGKFVRHDAFMAFSAGKRACAGEGLAKMELFLFFTGLLQAFTFYPPSGVSTEDLSLKPAIGFTLVPTPYMTFESCEVNDAVISNYFNQLLKLIHIQTILSSVTNVL
ncbi:unnamed protein product [Ranitomeya imitator]|uniref:Uncharacterized protein n=1 Tax=Ranitomeya imitator TaxID=111125 RepID=A0ABN9KRM1_9NEOB|nr:unnamed protein product [Ranitomeya imitator]